MQPQELREALMKAFHERNESFLSNPTCDPFAFIKDLQEQTALLFWAVGRLIAMIEERDNKQVH
jgi:hypothetical protein